MAKADRKWRSPKGESSKVKANVSLDPHIYLIGKNLGNLSALLNEAAKHFINSDSKFKKFLKTIQTDSIPVVPSEKTLN